MHLKFDNKLFSCLFYAGLLLAVVRVHASRWRPSSSSARLTADVGRSPDRRSVAVPGAPRGLAAGRVPRRRVRLHGPRHRPARRCRPGEPVVTRRQIVCFVAGDRLLLVRRQHWPMHDIGEKYLYSVHMLQHMMLQYFLPPLVLLATPEWMLRTLIGNGPHLPGAARGSPSRSSPACCSTRRDDHPHPRRGERRRPTNGAAALLAALPARHHRAADVDAGRRPVPGMQIGPGGKMHLPVPDERRARPCRPAG